MHLEHFHYFIQVAKTGSFSQTAQMLNLSQPTLSRYIQQLEQHLGIELLNRYHRPMTLTPAGKFFLHHIELNMQELSQIQELTRRFAIPHQTNQLTIGFVASILYGLLPEIISQLKQNLPKLEIKLVEISSTQQIDALKSGEIDVGFGRFQHHDGFIRQIFLRHERFVVALPLRHALAKKVIDDGILLKELVDEHLLLYHRSPSNNTGTIETDQLLRLFNQYQLMPQHYKKVRDIQIALGLVAAGEGFTLVPDSLKTVRTAQIHYHRLYHEDATTPIYLNLLANHVHPLIEPLLQATYQVYEQHGITYFPVENQ